MRAKDFMCAKVKDGIILIEALKDYRLRVLGSTMPSSVRGPDQVNSFYLTPVKEQKGLLAVFVSSGNGHILASFFLTVGFSSQEPVIDLENQWFPSPERLGQTYDKGIEVKIENILFSSRLRFNGELPDNYVDGNLLCRYLIGEVSAEDIRNATSELVEEMSARKKLPQIEKERKGFKADYISASEERDRLSSRVIELTHQLESMNEGYNRLRALVKKLQNSLTKKWFLGKDIKQMLKDISKE